MPDMDMTGKVERRPPTRLESILILAQADLAVLWRSWLCRGFLIISAVLTMLELKGMQSGEALASHMLEVVYTTYLIIWMHVVIFIAGGAFTREQDCLNDAILSRGVTRGDYIGAKIAARTGAILVMIVGILLPASLWAIRQDQLVRTDDGYVATHSRDTEVEAWDPKKLYAGSDGTIVERAVEQSDLVHVGDILGRLDDRELFDDFETQRRAEEDARSSVEDAQRRREEAMRDVADSQDALGRAKRALKGSDLLSRIERENREADLRKCERDLEDARSRVEKEKDAIESAQHILKNAQARVRESRIRLGHATITSPISGYVIESHVQEGQRVPRGQHLFTVAPLHEYKLRVPVYDFEDFQRLEKGLTAYVTVEKEEFTGTLERVGATTQTDRWGAKCNIATVRFSGQGKLGLLGRNADVRIVLPPQEEEETVTAALLNTITGHGSDDVETRTASVTAGWMVVALFKVIGCTCLLVTLSLLAAVITRSALISILGVTGIWHISNLIFDFVGLPELSYLEIIRTMDKVLAGVATTGDELLTIGWLFGMAAGLGALAVTAFIYRDPPK
jgi:multidrug resistance efflux pump